jgi:hypothetical protein
MKKASCGEGLDRRTLPLAPARWLSAGFSAQLAAGSSAFRATGGMWFICEGPGAGGLAADRDRIQHVGDGTAVPVSERDRHEEHPARQLRGQRVLDPTDAR